MQIICTKYICFGLITLQELRAAREIKGCDREAHLSVQDVILPRCDLVTVGDNYKRTYGRT